MTWAEVDARPEKRPDDEQAELRREVATALDRSPALTKYLRSVLQARCYAPGRKFEDMTYMDGQRSVARHLLQLGGQLNE